MEVVRIKAGESDKFHFLRTLHLRYPSSLPFPPFLHLTHLGFHVLGKIFANLIVIPRSSTHLSILLLVVSFLVFMRIKFKMLGVNV